jgi:hypothetical protein
MGKQILATLQQALREFVGSLAAFLPRLLAALAILAFGWLLAVLLRSVTRKLFRWVRLDQLVDRIGAGQPLGKLLGKPAHDVLARAVYWLTWIAVLLITFQALGLSGTDLLVADFVRFVPRLGAAILVLVIGFLLSGLAWRAALLAAVSAGMQGSKLLGTLVRSLVIVATVAMALEQIDVGRGVMHTAFALVFGAVTLATAIAFGLGGRHLARRFLEERLLARDRVEDDRDGSHM